MNLVLAKRWPARLWASVLKCGALSLLLLCTFASWAYAGEDEDRRIRAALRLFPSFLAADEDLEQKRSPDGSLLLVLVYEDRQLQSKRLAEQLSSREKICGFAIRVELTNDPSLKAYRNHPPAGIFLTQRLADDLSTVLRFGREHRVLIFTPFETDVKRGVPGGIKISDRIAPFVNVRALRSTGIRLKPFFMRVSSKYE